VFSSSVIFHSLIAIGSLLNRRKFYKRLTECAASKIKEAIQQSAIKEQSNDHPDAEPCDYPRAYYMRPPLSNA
jgi:hypothetical protein